MRITDLLTEVQTHRQDIFSPNNLQLLDETVHEVFGVTLGFEISPGTPMQPLEFEVGHDHQTAFISYTGTISGICELNLSLAAAISITSAMMGGPSVAADSEWVCDAVGELCNLLAGGWKNRVPGLGAGCSLSIPTVIAGNGYHIHRPPDLETSRRGYVFGDHDLLLTLMYDPAHSVSQRN